MADWKTNVIEDTPGIQELIRQTKTIAVLGIKPESHAGLPAHYVPAHMAAAGYEVIPVPVYYPEVTEILGRKVFRKLTAIGRSIAWSTSFGGRGTFRSTSTKSSPRNRRASGSNSESATTTRRANSRRRASKWCRIDV